MAADVYACTTLHISGSLGLNTDALPSCLTASVVAMLIEMTNGETALVV